MARHVVPGHAVRLNSCSTARIHEAADRSSASARRLRQCFPTSLGALRRIAPRVAATDRPGWQGPARRIGPATCAPCPDAAPSPGRCARWSDRAPHAARPGRVPAVGARSCGRRRPSSTARVRRRSGLSGRRASRAGRSAEVDGQVARGSHSLGLPDLGGHSRGWQLWQPDLSRKGVAFSAMRR